MPVVGELCPHTGKGTLTGVPPPVSPLGGPALSEAEVSSRLTNPTVSPRTPVTTSDSAPQRLLSATTIPPSP